MAQSLIASALSVLFVAAAASADIFQWEYINPSQPELGRRQSTTLCPDGAGVSAAPGANLRDRDLHHAYLAGSDLSFADITNAYLFGAVLDGADLTGSIVRGADLRLADMESAQLYSTASYQVGDLAGIGMPSNLNGWNLAGKNLANSDFAASTLVGADFTDAVIAGAKFYRATRSGFVASQLYSTASYRSGDLKGLFLHDNDLSGWVFAGKDLTGARLAMSMLTGTDFTGATIRGVDFYATVDRWWGGLTAAQLYSTASYISGDLRGIRMTANNLTGWDFAGKNLAGSEFYEADLTGVDFSGANLSGMDMWGSETAGASFIGADARGSRATPAFVSALTRNMIKADGHVAGLNVEAGETMCLRDDDGYAGNTWGAPLVPLTIAVDDGMSMAGDATLRAVFEDDAWGSRIIFQSGITISLDGTLELWIDPDDEIQLADLVGVTYDLFNWDGVAVTGQFARITTQPGLTWDTSKLYTTGEVTLTSIPEPASLALLGAGAVALLRRHRS